MSSSQDLTPLFKAVLCYLSVFFVISIYCLADVEYYHTQKTIIVSLVLVVFGIGLLGLLFITSLAASKEQKIGD